ncbi:DMT family transporter [Paracoccus sulfuroxidans]|uniref:EamA-like transporter family protein n=1 Tax=Paracoccus sulfuroxidans TaxID=384678 RepID=A0A562NX90_9RHOB|nr:DMT family transporter [Paracoccus sulfuroxidans]TWI36847.1 EamA-like transporter family protein [Paracoccus sulfuroxidans]
MDSQLSRRDAAWNLHGALFMVLAMACFTVEDSLLKAASRTLPVGEVLIAFGTIGLLIFSALAILAGERPFSSAMLSKVMLTRSAFEIVGRLFFMLAIALTPLSTASAILQATPLVVIAGAALVFHERVGPARWASVAIGFVGVLLILRPGTEGFGLLSIFAVIATLGFAGRDLATRAAPVSMSHRQLGVLGFLMLIVSGLIALPFGPAPVWPGGAAAASVIAGSLSGVIAYTSLTIAMRTGEVGAVTPFRYTRLVFAMIAGIVAFGERPDIWTIAGAALIIIAGVAALTRSK